MKKRIPINTKDSIYFIVSDDVLYCKSEGSSTTLFLKGDEAVIIPKNINAVEKLLEGNDFVRPHRSYLVNRSFIKLVDISDDYTLILLNQEKIPTAIQLRKEILDNLQTSS